MKKLMPNELLELVRAGYSKAEIEALSNEEGEKPDEKLDEKESKEEISDSNITETSDLDSLINQKVDNAFNKLNESVEAFNKKLESFNLMNAEMSSQMQEKNQSIEDILLGSILLPNGEEMKGEE